MALPTTLATVQCRLDTRRLGDGAPSSGRLVASPNFTATMTDPGTGLPVLLVGPHTAPVRAELVDGVATLELAATDDPDATYSGTPTWTIHERFPGGRDSWQLQVPHGSAGIDLATAAPAVVGPIVASYVQVGDNADTLGSGAATDGYVLTADGAGGAAWEAAMGGGGGGASALDDLTDVATAGADAGEALVFGGSSWGPSTAAVVLTGDSRLSDARTPTAHKSTHATGGGDALSAADVGAAAASHTHGEGDLPSTLATDTEVSGAVSTHLSGAPHVALASTTPAGLAPDGVGAVGSGTTAAKADHVHATPAAAPSSNLTAATSNAEGSSSSFSRADHAHAVTANVAASALGSSAAVGTAAALARADHVHPYPTAANVGAAATSHTHAGEDVTSGTVGTARLGSGSASASTFLRGDQTWATPSGCGSSDPLDANFVVSARILGR